MALKVPGEVMFALIIFAISIALAVDAQRYDAKSIEWIGGNFDWPSETTKELYKNEGRYISKNVIATRAVIYKDDAILTLPRFKPGVPTTLAKMSLKNKHASSPLMEPYPSWSFQEEGNCFALQSAVDVFIDIRGILWVLDSGVINSLVAPVRTCSPKVVAINPKTGKIVKTIALEKLTTSSSRLQYLMVDYSDYDHATVYVTDAAARAIIVYDVTSDHSFRMVLPKIVTAGSQKRDVLYALLLRRPGDPACIVFTYLGADRIFSVRTNNLRNGTISGKIHDLGEKPKKTVLLGTNDGSDIFFRYEGEPHIYRWDTTKTFGSTNFRKIFSGKPCYLTTQVMPDHKRNRMRLLQSNFPDFIQGTIGCGAEQAIFVI